MSDFKPVAWSTDTNIYEVNLRQYTPAGTFAAFEKELPRLRNMGIEVLWFMPVTPISTLKRLGSLGSYYACSDYTAINPEYGTMDDFKQLINAAHELNFKVIIDWVANHTGWDHRWTREHPDYYKKSNEGNFYDAHGWADVIDLNYDNPALQAAMIEAMRFWLTECNIDGFRCDMAMLVPLAFWKAARTALDKPKALFWLAECEETGYHEVFDATYGWQMLHKMEAYWRNETNVYGLYDVLNYYQSGFPENAYHLLCTTNHDENSHSGSEYERMGSAAKAFAVLCCTWNGMPLIYSGQELPNYKRLKFFDKDQIDWNGRYELNDFYTALLFLRKKNMALKAGTGSTTQRLSTGDNDHVMAYLRSSDLHHVLVVLNLSHAQNSSTIHDELPQGIYTNIFSGAVTDAAAARNSILEPWAFAVYDIKTVVRTVIYVMQ